MRFAYIFHYAFCILHFAFRASMDPELDPPPPIGKTWRRLYFAVLLNLAVLILLFYAFTRAYE